MDDNADRLLTRVGAAAGIVGVLLLVALFTLFPSLPGPDDSIDAIARSATTNREGLLLGAYAGTLMTVALLLFGVSVAERLRRAGADDGWWLVALVGITGTTIAIVGNALEVMFVRAVGHGVGGTTLWLGYGADHWLGILSAVPLALFLFAAGMGARATAVLPRWLSGLALVLSVVFLVGGASVAGDELDGGILGLPLVGGYLGLIVWIVATSIVMLRRRPGDVVEPASTRLATE